MATTKDTFERTDPALSSLERVQVADNAANAIINRTNARTDSWGSLIGKIKRFTDMVDKTAEVQKLSSIRNSR